jgi:CheY-like chemotaxis protein
MTRPRWKDEPQRRGLNIQVNLALDDLHPILEIPPELREALINLIFNAVDAMSCGGTLTLRGQLVDSSSRHRGKRTALPSQVTSCPAPACPAGRDQSTSWVELAVTDTGVGMPPEVQARIFEPFFTTKGVRGTGLGLAVVYGIMKRHGGTVEVASAPMQGATFTLRFRRADTPGPVPVATPVAATTRRLLVVDDEPVVLTTVAALLRAAGHTVLEAADGPAALALLAREPLDLAFTDLGMPDMNGWELAREIKARRPGLPVVLLTGWRDPTPGDDQTERHVDTILGKPIRLGDVLRVIDRLTTTRR